LYYESFLKDYDYDIISFTDLLLHLIILEIVATSMIY
jgi:hypothetical protein